MSCDCPKCGSSSTASFEIMHQQGTQSGSITASSATFGGDVGIINGQFNSQTVLAGKLSPPIEPKMGCLVQILIAVVSTTLSVLISGAVLTAIDMFIEISARNDVMALPLLMFIGFLLYGIYLYNQYIQRKKMPAYYEQAKDWSNSLICRRCGIMWVRE